MSTAEIVEAPDLEAAADLMVRAWDRPCWHYTPEILREYLHRPSGRPELTVGARQAEKLVGLYAGIPIAVRYHDAMLRAVFATFLTVDPEAKDFTLLLRLYRHFLETAREADRTHLFTVFFPSKETHQGLQVMDRLAGAPMQILSDIPFQVGARPLVEPGLQTSLPAPFEVIPYRTRHRQACARLLGQLSCSLPLAVIVPERDTDAALAGSPATTTLLLREGDAIRGLITGRRREILRDNLQRTVQIDHWTTDVDPEVTQRFLDRALATFFARGVDSITVPVQGHLQHEWFQQRGFMETPGGAVLGVAYLDDDAQRVAPGLPSFFEVY